MTLHQYLRNRELREKSMWQPRGICPRCRKSTTTCFCSHIRPFESQPQFVILIHPLESRRSVATGRMAHLCLKNSRLHRGVDFSNHENVNALIQSPENHCVVLSPRLGSTDLSALSSQERESFFPKGKHLVVFVIDGTWAQARRMMRLSTNLRALPGICFTPTTASQFQVRRQPAPHCYSTIEAIHHCLDLFGQDIRNERAGLLSAFSAMVQDQLTFIRENAARSEPYRHRLGKKRAKPGPN